MILLVYLIYSSKRGFSLGSQLHSATEMTNGVQVTLTTKHAIAFTNSSEEYILVFYFRKK